MDVLCSYCFKLFRVPGAGWHRCPHCGRLVLIQG
jgi:rRNA maturation endonuclease Nob1